MVYIEQMSLTETIRALKEKSVAEENRKRGERAEIATKIEEKIGSLDREIVSGLLNPPLNALVERVDLGMLEELGRIVEEELKPEKTVGPVVEAVVCRSSSKCKPRSGRLLLSIPPRDIAGGSHTFRTDAPWRYATEGLPRTKRGEELSWQGSCACVDKAHRDESPFRMDYLKLAREGGMSAKKLKEHLEFWDGLGKNDFDLRRLGARVAYTWASKRWEQMMSVEVLLLVWGEPSSPRLELRQTLTPGRLLSRKRPTDFRKLRLPLGKGDIDKMIEDSISETYVAWCGPHS